MTQVIASRIMKVPASDVWQVISHYNAVHVFHPFVASADQLGEKARGLGAKRRCNLYNDLSIVEEVIQWDEGQGFIVKSTNAPIIGRVSGGLRVEATGEHESRVTVDMVYEPKGGLFGRMVDVLVFKRLFQFPLNKVLKGLQHHMETGELIGRNGRVS